MNLCKKKGSAGGNKEMQMWLREKGLQEYLYGLVMMIFMRKRTPFAFDISRKLKEDNGGRRRYQSGIL